MYIKNRFVLLSMMILGWLTLFNHAAHAQDRATIERYVAAVTTGNSSSSDLTKKDATLPALTAELLRYYEKCIAESGGVFDKEDELEWWQQQLSPLAAYAMKNENLAVAILELAIKLAHAPNPFVLEPFMPLLSKILPEAGQAKWFQRALGMQLLTVSLERAHAVDPLVDQDEATDKLVQTLQKELPVLISTNRRPGLTAAALRLAKALRSVFGVYPIYCDKVEQLVEMVQEAGDGEEEDKMLQHTAYLGLTWVVQDPVNEASQMSAVAALSALLEEGVVTPQLAIHWESGLIQNRAGVRGLVQAVNHASNDEGRQARLSSKLGAFYQELAKHANAAKIDQQERAQVRALGTLTRRLLNLGMLLQAGKPKAQTEIARTLQYPLMAIASMVFDDALPSYFQDFCFQAELTPQLRLGLAVAYSNSIPAGKKYAAAAAHARRLVVELGKTGTTTDPTLTMEGWVAATVAHYDQENTRRGQVVDREGVVTVYSHTNPLEKPAYNVLNDALGSMRLGLADLGLKANGAARLDPAQLLKIQFINSGMPLLPGH